MNLTDNFTLAELSKSAYAARHEIDNTPNLQVIANLTELCMVLERIRLVCGGPVIVSSGYRCGKLNSAIGGSKTSAHVRGSAADFTVSGQTPKQSALLIAPLVKELGIDQLIYEFGEWVHVGLSDNPRRQILTATKQNGQTVYIQGVI